MRKRNIIILVVFALAIAAVILIPGSSKSPAPRGTSGAVPGIPSGGPPGGGPGGDTGSRGGRDTAQSRPATVFSVKTEIARRGVLQEYIQTNGDVIVDPTVDIYPDVGGKLVSLRVSLGSRVTRGQHIADVDRSTPGSSYELNPVRSTISGTITSLPLSTGATVTTNSVIAKVGDLDNLQVVARIPERYVGVLRVGLKAKISLEAYPDRSFPATVSQVAPLLDSTSRTKEIRLTFDSPDPRINAGMYVRIKIDTVRYENSLLVSSGSVLADSAGRYVFVVGEDGVVSRRTVTVGAEVDGILAIESGLSEGERIVSEGTALLTDGARIKDISVPESSPKAGPGGTP